MVHFFIKNSNCGAFLAISYLHFSAVLVEHVHEQASVTLGYCQNELSCLNLLTCNDIMYNV